MSINVFLDTEFTAFKNSKLISIGLVAETGQEFYAEVPFDLDDCTDFVKMIVIPLLHKVPGAETDKLKLYGELFHWLDTIRPRDHEDDRIFICYDYETDWNLFIDAMNYRVPTFVDRKIITHRLNRSKLKLYWLKSGEPQHHSLCDARANKFAYEPS